MPDYDVIIVGAGNAAKEIRLRPVPMKQLKIPAVFTEFKRSGPLN
jgi:hypothetical protein